MIDRHKYRTDRLMANKNKCDWCLKGPWCSACKAEIDILDISIPSPRRPQTGQHTIGTETHLVQMPYIIDHDHSCENGKCKGCSKCYRGITHDYCNRYSIRIAESGPHLQSDFIKQYLGVK